MLLEGEDITKYFGGLAALKDVDFGIEKGEILGLIGPNGAGKTTLFNVVTGIYKPTSGVVKFNGKRITGLKPHKLTRLGIARTFQIVQPLKTMTVLDNVVTGALFGRSKAKGMDGARRYALEMLEFAGLDKKMDHFVEELTIADLKSLELCRALATKPELLMLDEVVAGLNPIETETTMKLIEKIRDDGVTVFMIEHVMRAVMGVSDRIIVLDSGQKIAEGVPEKIASDQKVIQAYLGEKYALQRK